MTMALHHIRERERERGEIQYCTGYDDALYCMIQCGVPHESEGCSERARRGEGLITGTVTTIQCTTIQCTLQYGTGVPTSAQYCRYSIDI